MVRRSERKRRIQTVAMRARGVCLILWTNATAYQRSRRKMVESLSNPLFHNVKLSFILIFQRFYLQCTEHQANSPRCEAKRNSFAACPAHPKVQPSPPQ